MQQLVSIIVPIYKVEQYLEKCIENLINQTYKNVEIILVDDGSPDNCPLICDEFAQKDSRIVVLHKTNGGLSDARNAGLKIAKGEWIVFIDSDDFVHLQMIEILMDTATKYEADLAWCSIKETDENGYADNIKIEGDEQLEVLNDNNTVVMTNSEAEEKFFSMAMKQEALVAWNKLYHRSLFTEDGEPIWYPIGKIFEDGYTTYRLIYQAKKVVAARLPLYYYRQRGGSIMNQNSFKTYEPALDAGELRIKFYLKNNEDELVKKEINLNMYLCIQFYEKTKDRKTKKYLKGWFKKYYDNYYVNESWPKAKTIRFKMFMIGYPLYKCLSGFEGLYNKIKK